MLFMGPECDLCKEEFVLLLVNLAYLTNLSNVAILYIVNLLTPND